jgi:hypothetical protein
VQNFASIANTLMNLQPDQYITEIAEERNELFNVGLEVSPSLAHYKSAIDFLIHRIKNAMFKKGISRITQGFRLQYYTNVKKILRDGKAVIDCYAGISSVQISSGGDVWYCCMKAESSGNLRNVNLDFNKIWNSKEFQNKRTEIKSRKCFCPLANAAYTNMLMDYRTLFKVFISSFIMYKR